MRFVIGGKDKSSACLELFQKSIFLGPGIPMCNAAIRFFSLGSQLGDVFSFGMDLMALGRGTTFAALKQHTKG
jgi:hypothetical protein